jgi:hypothetical protein
MTPKDTLYLIRSLEVCQWLRSGSGFTEVLGASGCREDRRQHFGLGISSLVRFQDTIALFYYLLRRVERCLAAGRLSQPQSLTELKGAERLRVYRFSETCKL